MTCRAERLLYRANPRGFSVPGTGGHGLRLGLNKCLLPPRVTLENSGQCRMSKYPDSMLV